MNKVPRKTPYLQMIDGAPRSPLLRPEVYRAASKFTPTANDVILVTYPKSGTHWLSQIVVLVLNKGRSPRGLQGLARQAPFIEYQGVAASNRSPRLLRTHLPFGQLQYDKHAKYIYVARNPWDTCVSFYHHVKQLLHYGFLGGTFEDFVEAFLKSKVGQPDHLDHVLSGYARRDEPNVLFLTYEELRADTAGTVLKLARFLGKPYASMFDQDSGLMDEVLFKSSVDYMRGTHEVNLEELSMIYNYSPISEEIEAEVKNIRNGTTRFCFVRKGTAGDWRSHFSPQLLEQMQAWINDKTRDSDVMSLWGNELTANNLAQVARN
ncbi:unnamed protein product [Ixodes hexagonus]